MIVSPNHHLKIPKYCRQAAKNSSAVFSISLKDYSDQIGLLSSIHESTIAFKTVDISLADSIQRYNLIWQHDITPKEAQKRANSMGDAWIAYYLPLIPGREPKIIKWDHWLEHPNFKNSQNFIELYYKKDKDFQNSINDAAIEYLSRYNNKHPIDNIPKALQLSIKLIKEEISVLALQANIGYEYEIFFEIRNAGLKYFYEYILWSKNASQLKPILAKIKL